MFCFFCQTLGWQSKLTLLSGFFEGNRWNSLKQLHIPLFLHTFYDVDDDVHIKETIESNFCKS